MANERPNIDDILRKHSARIETQIKSEVRNVNYSREYVKFKQEMAPDLTRYERWCNSLGKIIKLKISEKDEKIIKRQLEIAHLEIEPWQSVTLSIMSFVAVFLIGLFISVAVVLIKGSISNFPLLFFFLMLFFLCKQLKKIKQFPKE